MKNMMIFGMSVVLGAAISAGYFLMQNKKEIIAPKKSENAVTYQKFSIATPPSQSIKGKILASQGELLWESRVATEASTLSDSSLTIGQGELIITKENGSANLSFPGLGTLEVGENTEISFIQTLPVDFLVQQKRGTVVYKVIGGVPLSVRIRTAIITKDKGSFQLSMQDNDSIITIKTISGDAKIGFNDLDFVSQVFDLKEGQVYEYNSDQRTAINVSKK